MGRPRQEQLAYSDLQPLMHQENLRRKKAAKIIAVVCHALGRQDLSGLSLLDVGCSTGFMAHEFSKSGATVIGVDIDEPGIAQATERFGDAVQFLVERGERIPLDDASQDILIFNHIYEHVVDPEAVVAELRRVLKPTGLLYLGLGNRLGIIEPHYRLPFLSWLPKPLSHRYMRLTRKGNEYYETFRTRHGLKKLFADFHCWDYTLSVITDPQSFSSEDQVPGLVAKLPRAVLAALLPLVPTYVWVASKTPFTPRGAALRIPPRAV